MLLIVSCGVPKNKARLSGKFDNLGTAIICVYTDDGSLAGIDTITLEKGSFTKDYDLTEPTLATVLFPNFSERYVILTPGKETQLRGDANHLIGVKITGTEENEALTTFREENLEKSEADQRMAATKFIEDNPSSLASLALFRTYFAEPLPANAPNILRILKKLAPHLEKYPAFRVTANALRPQLNTAIGERLPRFSAKTLDGHTITETDFKGQPLLVLCSALWAPESRVYLSRLSRLKKTAPQVRQLVVAFDLDRTAIEQFISIDSISAPILFDGEGLFSPLHSTFGVRTIPEVFLINSQGRITARGLKPEQLDRALESLK